LNQPTNNISLKKLFVEFLRIGSLSFGGFMALISMIEERFVEKGGYLKNQTLLDGISIASVLPGPIAVNVVTYVGYRLHGMKGALLSMFAVLIPTFIFIVVLSHFYFLYGDIPEVGKIFLGILPAVCAIILAVALNMARKNLKDKSQIVIVIVAAAVLLGVGGFWSTLLIMIMSAISGYFLFGKEERGKSMVSSEQVHHKWYEVLKTNRVFFFSLILVILLIVALPLFFPVPEAGNIGMLRKLIMTFGGVSVTLFGGGYVFIPMLQELIVEHLHWLTTKEFVDGIALGQITPGPIMISAAFIGYKMSGILGAVVGTISMFLPPAILMVVVSHFIEQIKSSASVAAVFRGVRPAVIGMIFAAAYIIGHELTPDWATFLIGIAVFVLSFKFKVSVMYLIPLSGVAGWLLF